MNGKGEEGRGGNTHLGASSSLQEDEAAAKPWGVTAAGAQGAGCDAAGGDETGTEAAPHCHCHQRGGRHGRAALGGRFGCERGKTTRLVDEMWRTEGISAAAEGIALWAQTDPGFGPHFSFSAHP
jgi:hypothetical protein